MARDATFESDKSIGLAVILGALGLASAASMLVAPGTLAGAFGFAAAMTVGVVLVVALHVHQ